MEAGFTALISIACLVIGLLVGMISKRSAQPTRPVQGILNVDCTIPEEGPGLFLALTVPVDDIVSSKQVTFDVRVHRANSQK